MGDRPDLEQLIAALRARVEERRSDGEYPSGLEDDLDRHFKHIVGEHRPPSTAVLLDELDAARAQLANFAFSRESISTESQLPGGSAMHRAVAKATARQIQGVLEQAQAHAQVISHTIGLMVDVTDSIADTYDRSVMQQLDDLQLRLAEHQRELHRMVARLDELAGGVPGAPVDPWYSAAAFTAHFGGDLDENRARYADLAARFVGCDPVLDLDLGRGEFLDVLRDLGVDARGVGTDIHAVESARNRGLRAEVAPAFAYLRDLDDGTLGGLVIRHVIERLPPQHAIDVVRLASEKVRRGGKVLIETMNPTSLVTHARSLGIGPELVRPLHPSFLTFLFVEAGFADIERVDRSPVATDESLELLPGDDELTKRLNANFERVNTLLYGPQGYAVLATR